MNKMTLKTGIFALMTSAALMAPAVSAGYDGCDRAYHEMCSEHRGGHGDMRKMFRGLNLTDAQRSEVKTLMQNHREAMQAKRPSQEVRQAHKQQMLELITADSVNEADVESMFEQRRQQRSLAAVERVKLQRSIYQILTPEQQAQFKQNFVQQRGRKGDRR